MYLDQVKCCCEQRKLRGWQPPRDRFHGLNGLEGLDGFSWFGLKGLGGQLGFWLTGGPIQPLNYFAVPIGPAISGDWKGVLASPIAMPMSSISSVAALTQFRDPFKAGEMSYEAWAERPGRMLSNVVRGIPRVGSGAITGCAVGWIAGPLGCVFGGAAGATAVVGHISTDRTRQADDLKTQLIRGGFEGMSAAGVASLTAAATIGVSAGVSAFTAGGGVPLAPGVVGPVGAEQALLPTLSTSFSAGWHGFTGAMSQGVLATLAAKYPGAQYGALVAMKYGTTAAARTAVPVEMTGQAVQDLAPERVLAAEEEWYRGFDSIPSLWDQVDLPSPELLFG